MLLDANLQLSSAQAVTVTAVSTNTIDLGVARDVGAGEDLYAIIGVDTTATAAGAATVTFEVIVADDAALTVNVTVLVATAAIAIAELTAGREPISLCIPPSALASLPKGRRYMGLRYTVATGPLTAGAFTCHIGDSEVAAAGKYYASGYSVA